MISNSPFVDLYTGTCATAVPVISAYDQFTTSFNSNDSSQGITAKQVTSIPASSPITGYTDSFMRYSYSLLKHPSPSAYVSQLQLYYQIICQSQLTHTNMAIALYFLYRYLRNTLNQCDPSMTYQIMLTALVLSNKSFDDQSYTLKTWSNLLDMDLSILNQLEAHFLNVTNFSLPFNKIDEEFYHTFGPDDQFREFVRSLLSPKEEITTPEVAQPLTISPLLYQPMMKAPVSFPHQVTNLFTPGSSFATPSSTVTGSVTMLPQTTFHVPHLQGSLYSYPVRHYPRQYNNFNNINNSGNNFYPSHHHSVSFSSPLSSICSSPQMLNSPHYTIHTTSSTAFRGPVLISTFSHISQPPLKRRRLQQAHV